MEPPVFVLPLSCWFQNGFGFQNWTYFSGTRKLLTSLNHKGPPDYEKSKKKFRKLFLTAQKKQRKTPQLLTMYG